MKQQILTFFQADAAKGYGLAIFAAVSFGLGTTLTKAASLIAPEIDFLNVAVWGWGIAIVIFSCFYLPQAKARQGLYTVGTQHWPITLKITILGVLNSLGWFYAISVVEGGILSLLDLSLILWSFFLGMLFLGERFRIKELPGILMALSGIIFISSLQSGAALSGVIAIFLANFSLALQSLLLRAYQPSLDTIALTYIRAWGLWLSFAVPLIILGRINFDLSWAFLGLVGVGQVLGLFMGRGAYITAHRYLPVSRLSLILLLAPVVAILSAWMIIGEPITVAKVTGGGLILGGLAWFIQAGRRSKKTKIDL